MGVGMAVGPTGPLRHERSNPSPTYKYSKMSFDREEGVQCGLPTSVLEFTKAKGLRDMGGRVRG